MDDVDWDSFSSRETAVNIMVSAWRSCIKPLVGKQLRQKLREMVDGVDGAEGDTPEKSLRATVESSVPKGVNPDWNRWPDVGKHRRDNMDAWLKVAHIFLQGDTVLFKQGRKRSQRTNSIYWTDEAFVDLLKLLPGDLDRGDVMRRVFDLDSTMGVEESCVIRWNE